MENTSPVFLTATKINLRRLVLLRWLAIIGQVSAVFTATRFLHLELPLQGMAMVIAASLAFNLYAHWRSGRADRDVSSAEFFYHLLFDTAVLSALLYFAGGATNPFGFLYLLPITISAAVLPARYTWSLAAITIAAYSLLIAFYVPLPQAHHNHTDAFNLHVFGMWLGFVLSAVMVAYFVVGMGNSLRRQEQILVKAREDALRNERLVAIGTLAASTAHELGTPLGTMALLTDELQHSPALADEETRDIVQTLQAQVQRCKDALAELSVSAGNVSASDGGVQKIDDYLAQLLSQWQQSRSDIEVHCQWQGLQPAPKLLVDRTLSQALFNILDNAAEASSDADGQHRIDWRADWDEQWLHMEIRDYGSGLPEEARSQAGKMPFSRKQDGHKKDGMGLGLFLAHAVIERFGGEVHLSNHQEGGLCTRISLPVTATGDRGNKSAGGDSRE